MSLLRPRYIIAAFVIGLVIGWLSIDVAHASGRADRARLTEGTGLVVPHDGGHWCWNYKVRPNGRPVAIIKTTGWRTGAVCRGQRDVVVLLPRGTHEDGVAVFSTGLAVRVWVGY